MSQEMTTSSILDYCFGKLSKTENVSRTNILTGYVESWLIETEVPYDTFLKEVDLIINFPFEFPVIPPKVFLEKDFYDETKYLPHVNEDRSICLFDDAFTYVDTEHPFNIITECLKKAKNILQIGLEKKNIKDFSEEIQAYWAHSYHDKDVVSTEYVSLLDNNIIQSRRVKLLEITPSYNYVFKYFLTESPNCEFIQYLEENKYKTIEYEALYLNKFNLRETPPYNYSNIDFLNSLTTLDRREFDNYINNSSSPHVFFLQNDKILGFRIPPLNIKRNGFRLGSLTPSKVMQTFQKNDYLARVLVSKYNSKRIEKRTSGVQNVMFRFIIVGLGSIGSNLTYFLNAINYPSFTFVDNDVLTIDNIGRHLLGFDAVYKNKAKALRNHLKNIRPDQNIVAKDTSILTILAKDLELFNNNDFAFICIGNRNVEDHILDLLNSKKIIVPTFILWVEPFLIGGHCVFIHPDNPISKEQLFNKHKYKYNVISEKSYNEKKEIFLMKEAGCQTSYIPYSANHITLFLSQIYCYINDQIKSSSNDSFLIRWAGNLEFANSLGVLINVDTEIKYNVQKIKLPSPQ